MKTAQFMSHFSEFYIYRACLHSKCLLLKTSAIELSENVNRMCYVNLEF